VYDTKRYKAVKKEVQNRICSKNSAL